MERQKYNIYIFIHLGPFQNLHLMSYSLWAHRINFESLKTKNIYVQKFAPKPEWTHTGREEGVGGQGSQHGEDSQSSAQEILQEQFH